MLRQHSCRIVRQEGEADVFDLRRLGTEESLDIDVDSEDGVHLT